MGPGSFSYHLDPCHRGAGDLEGHSSCLSDLTTIVPLNDVPYTVFNSKRTDRPKYKLVSSVSNDFTGDCLGF